MFRYESQNRPWISQTSSCRHFAISLHRNIFPELIFCYSTSFRGVSKDFWLCQLILKERLDVSLPPLRSRNFRGCRSVRGCLDVRRVGKSLMQSFRSRKKLRTRRKLIFPAPKHWLRNISTWPLIIVIDDSISHKFSRRAHDDFHLSLF